jgi:anti-anti-sigma factor
MQTRLESTDKFAIIHVQGRIDSLTAIVFEENACGFIKEAQQDIILDFTEVVYISSAGLRSLLIIAKKCKETNIKIILCGMNESIADVIRITGFINLFVVSPNLISALYS